MNTDNRTNELTPEQILVDEWARQADRAKSMTGMDAIWFPDAEETLAVLRANGLLSEGTPSEAQVERAARALFEDPHMSADYTWAELVEDDPTRAEIWRIDARRTLTAAAGVAPQEPSRLPDFFAPKPMPNSYVPAQVLPSSGVDEEKLAEVRREAAEKALTEAANELSLLDDGGKRGLAGHSKSSASAITHRHAVAVVRARAEAYRQERGER